MEKENGDAGSDASGGGGGGGGKQQDGLLDAASLFGAYWGRDGGASGGSAANAAAAQAALFGFGGRYPQPSTLGVAANQAASLGLHPANAAWWSMASHLAAQDYLARLQGLSFPQLDPYSMGMQQKHKGKPAKNERSSRNSSSSTSSSASTKDKSPATSSAQANMRSSYGFPKTSSPSTLPQQSALSSLASLNSLVSGHAQAKNTQQKHSRKSSTKSAAVKDRDLAMLRGDLMLAQAAAQNAYHAAVAAHKGGKNSSPFNPFAMGSDKDGRHGLDSLAGLPHNILSDPASVLGGVRLPPDTEIIKYTSSMQGTKSSPGSGSGRGRKKTISLDPPQVSVLPSTLDRSTGLPSKRQKMDADYAGSSSQQPASSSRSSVEVIRLPSRQSAHSSQPFNLSDYAGLSKELLQSIANQSGLSLAALERELSGSASTGLNLSSKSSSSTQADTPLDLGVSSSAAVDDDAPLNLSLKPSSSSSTHASDALSRLTSLSSSLSAGSNTDRISRRKPGAKPRRVLPEGEPMADSPRPKSSGSEDSESVGGWGSSREGRPRNLGRGVSKPKKNTVASLLAQSRALGLRPALAQQLLGETDIEKLRAVLGDVSTDECGSDSRSDSDASEGSTTTEHLRLPLAMGWSRLTIMKGLSKSGCIKGDVTYSPPEPHSALQLKSMQELMVFLEQSPCPPLTTDNFTFSARRVLGSYRQLGADSTQSESEILKRLEEARALAALSSIASGRPTPPPPVDRRIELARQQQAAREARREATQRGRDQARIAREVERTEKAEQAKREKEAKNQQMLEHINKNRTQLSIQLLPQMRPKAHWSTPDISLEPAAKHSKPRHMAPISLSLIPVTKEKEAVTINVDESGWKDQIEEYNALDKMMDFAKSSFPKDAKYDFDLTIVKAEKDKRKDRDKHIAGSSKKSMQEQNYEQLLQAYSRMTDFVQRNDWSRGLSKSGIETTDAKEMEKRYLDAKNDYMSQYLQLTANGNQKSVIKEEEIEVIDLSDDDKEIARIQKQYGLADGVSMVRFPAKDIPAKKRKQEEIEKQRLEEQAKKQQERDFKRQQAVMMKEQKYLAEVTKQRDLMFTVELERERRRQHTTLVRQLDLRRRWEDRERRKHQNLMDRLLAKEKKLQGRRREMRLLAELRRPQEDSTLSDQKALPTLNRIPGLKLPGQAMGDVLQVLEFIHNFGQTLGFDMESLPTLNTLQMALLPDCCVEAEEELMNVLTHLLVCAIEDPGIPHPGRHTTLLGQALRMGDITPANISEVLRIYLYANATGEVKAISGVNAERERERRVADHHQSEAEMLSTCHNAKNQIYYEHLHNNPTYRLSEALRDKPFHALSPTTKARILAYICDELLQSKAVIRQIEASLERLSRLRKERLVQDMKIRKVRALHQRKSRSEQAERQQALALERMQRLVEESVGGDVRAVTPSDDTDHSMAPPSNPEKQPPSEESSPSKDPETMEEDHETGSPQKESSVEKEIRSRKNSISKEMLNNNKEAASPAEVSKLDKDSMLGDVEALLSDVESEGTQPEEDEDKNLSSEELARKLEKLLRQSEQQVQQLTAGAHSLRATCYGQDRYWRRYWALGACGGVYVEAMESAQPELLPYQRRLEVAAKRRDERRQENEISRKKRAKARKGQKKSLERTTSQEAETKETSAEAEPASKTEDQIKSELELKNIKSELNLSDHTQIIKYEPNLKGNCKIEGSPIKMEEKYIQHQQNNELDMLDIEDSIPTAFLVQKPSLNKFGNQAESIDKPQEIKVENNSTKPGPTEVNETQEDKNDQQLINNLEELRKMAEAVAQVAKEENANEEVEVKEEKPHVKQEEIEPETAHQYLYTKMLEGRWFSILRKEHSLLTKNQDLSDKTQNSDSNGSQNVPVFFDNAQTCSEVILCQGHRWDVSNNLHLLNDPSLFTLNSMVTTAQVPVNNIYLDSSLTMSGIDQDVLDNENLDLEDFDDSDKEDDFEKELNLEEDKTDVVKKNSNVGNPLGLLNFNALSTYVTCDSPPPLQMSPEEYEQLEYCKVNGLPKKSEGNFVPRELRHGWWRIMDPDMLKDLIQALHPRGVRERELYTAFMQHLSTVNNKLHIDPGDSKNAELSISHRDRVIAQNGGFPSPDPPGSYSAKTQRRIDTAVLQQVEQLEERVSAASLQVKGWRPRRTATSPATDAPTQSVVHVARTKLAQLEANIERRYLKPPLQSSGDATLGAAVLQAESQASAQSPHTPEKNDSGVHDAKETKGLPRGLVTWREAVSRCQTTSQISMCLTALESSIAWDKSIMKANCQFCQSGDNDDQLLLCDGCDKGYHTYCFKPKMEKIPDGDWYCWECVNKARGDKVCIVCGGAASGGGRGRLLPCTLCSRAYHQLCHYPPLGKSPRGKWYCSKCASKAPPKKPRSSGKKKDSRRESSAPLDTSDQLMVPSPAPSHASTSTTADDCQSTCQPTPEKQPEQTEATENENGHDNSVAAPDMLPEELAASPAHCGGNGIEHESEGEVETEREREVREGRERKKREKRTQKELQLCRTLLEEMELHQDAWPFLLPVNTKQFPTYKKVIRSPMDLSTIKRKLHDGSYKSKEEFAEDVCQIFTNCEVFNEDESPVGRAGHGMRRFFTERFHQLLPA